MDFSPRSAPAIEPQARLQAALEAFERSCQEVLEAIEELSFRAIAEGSSEEASRLREVADAAVARAARSQT